MTKGKKLSNVAYFDPGCNQLDGASLDKVDLATIAKYGADIWNHLGHESPPSYMGLEQTEQVCIQYPPGCLYCIEGNN